MNRTQSMPDENGHFGKYGGRFVPETLMHALVELEKAYHDAQADKEFQIKLMLSVSALFISN